jgi:hypothetical protein
MVSMIFLCVLLITGLLLLNRLSFSSNAISTTNPQITHIVIDDSSQGIGTNEINYVGTGWQHSLSQCPGSNCHGTPPYNGSNSWDKTVDDYVTISFTGIQIQFYGLIDPHHGIGAVSIDGNRETMIDFYAPNRQGNQLLWISPLLPAGAHTFKLRVTGNKSPRSLDTYVIMDRVDILSY